MCMEATSGRNKMTNTVSVCVFYALLCATIVKASIMVEIEPKRETAVRVGETLQILCRANRPLRVCRVEIPGESNAIVLLPDDKPEDGIRFYGNGFNEGECGVSIAKVKDTHDGVFKCFLTPTDSRQETSASLRIIVARPPNAPIINVNRATSYGEDAFKNGERLDVSCSAPAGRPAANVTLFLDDELITQDSSVNYNSPAMQNLSRVLDWKDNGKMLRCLAHHIALDRPLESTYLLNVHYAPQPEETFQRFGYVIGRQGVINVTVYANPKPKFTWRVNNEKIDEGRPDNSGRLETSSAVDLGRGAWSLIMTIDSVQKSDTEKEYTLEAANIMGTNEYRVVLSTSSEPAGVDLDAGSIIGIVVGVLALVLVIFLVIFARATGRWCFAARRRGDEEAAGDVGAGSEAHIAPGDEDDEDHGDPRIIDEKVPQGGQENPIHASTEYVNGRTDIKDAKKDEKTDTPV